MGKLGATTQDATTVMVDFAALDVGDDVVNGPEDLLDWDAISWRRQEEKVRRLRQRIFKATQAGDLETGPQSAEADCATRRPVISPAQPGGTRREVPGSDG